MSVCLMIEHWSATETTTYLASQNLVPKWTWTAVMMNSDLHVHVLNAKLNPELSKYVEIAHTELDYGWDIDVPKPNSKHSHSPLSQLHG